MPKLLLIIASTRPNRVGDAIADWVLQRARQEGSFDVEVADLRELDLPHLDEPNHPLLREYTKPHTFAWSAMVDSADAFLVVTPEYNYAVAPAFLNALDYLYHEWTYKPIAFVSYGGVSGGMRAVVMARQIAATLKMVAIPEQVNIVDVKRQVSEGRLESTDILDRSLDRVLGELSRWQPALATIRQKGA